MEMCILSYEKSFDLGVLLEIHIIVFLEDTAFSTLYVYSVIYKEMYHISQAALFCH